MDKLIWKLLKLDVTVTLRNFVGGIARDRGGWRAVITLVLMGLGFVPLAIIMIGTGVGGYAVLRMVGQPDATLTVFLVLGQFVALVFGFFYVMSAFFFSRDLKILVPLPISPSSLVAAKFLRVVLTEYLTMAVVIIPAYVAYGIGSGSALYWPAALLVFLLSPVLPLAIDGLLVMVLMRVTASRKVQVSRDLFRVVGAVAGIGLFLFFQFNARHEVSRGFDQNPFTQMVSTKLDLIQKVGSYIPPSIWATRAMAAPTSGGGAAGLAGYLGINAVLLGLLFVGANKLYFTGLLADEGGRARQVATAGEVSAAASRVSTPAAALFRRELLLLVRTPMFVINAIIPLVIIPTMLVAPAISSGSITTVRTALSDPASPFAPFVSLMMTGVLLLMAASTPLSSTAISREGRKFWISRILPVDPAVHVWAKLAVGMLHTAVAAVLVGVVAVVMLHVPIAVVLIGAVGGLCAAAVSHLLGIMIDLIRPSLNWLEPQAAMKGNINGLFGMLASLVEVALLGGVTALVALFQPRWAMPAVTIVSLGIAYGLYQWTGHMARVRFSEIEA